MQREDAGMPMEQPMRILTPKFIENQSRLENESTLTDVAPNWGGVKCVFMPYNGVYEKDEACYACPKHVETSSYIPSWKYNKISLSRRGDAV